VGAALLVWIFHSIFVNEAREQSKRMPSELHDRGRQIDNTMWQRLPRTEQWRLGWTYGPPPLWRTLRSVRLADFAISLLLMGATLALGVARWRMVLAVPGLRLPYKRAAEISFVAHFFNSFLLGTAGGDVMKAVYVARETHHKKTEAVVTVFVDRVIGLWAMLLFATLMIIPNYTLFERTGLGRAARRLLSEPAQALVDFWHIIYNEPMVGASAILSVMTVLSSGFVFLAFRGGVSRRWAGARAWLRRLPKGDWIERSLESCREFGRQRGFVAKTVALSMLLNFIAVLQFWVLARGLGMNVGPLPLCLIVPSVICLAAAPISVSGVGVRDLLFVHLLAAPTIAAHPTDALSLSLLAFAGSLFWSLVGGAVYVMFKEKHHLSEKELQAET
jgi:uncharacterized membrane protein YbhN (UPF0104 family)